MRLIYRLFEFAARRSHAPGSDGSAGALGTPAQDRVDYADMERALLAEGHIFGLTVSGALCLRHTSDAPGPSFCWKSLPSDLLARFIRGFLVERGLTHLWSGVLVQEFAEFLRAGAERHRPSEKFLAG
jgi:hypothetical protein